MKHYFLNVRLDEELNDLVEKAKADYFINPCQLVRKLLKNALKEIIKEEIKNV